MIEINLIPDVKYQLLKARRMRATVISFSIVSVVIISSVVALLAVYVYVFQGISLQQADKTIATEFDKLKKQQDLSKTLTIQNQLKQLSTLHDKTPQTSRIFEFLAQAIPPATDKNTVSVSTLKLNTEKQEITMEAQAKNGFEALEVFKKTMEQTVLQYPKGDSASDGLETVVIASEIQDSDPSYGQNSRGEQVLRFTLKFKYADELFDPSVKNFEIKGPSSQVATDSAVGIPDSLFTDRSKETN